MSKTILLTGGGSGIGRGLAEEFLKRGHTVIIAGRRLEQLATVCAANPGMHFAPLDLQDAAGIPAFAQDILARFPALDTLINNAGVMRFENLAEDANAAVAESTIATNLLGPIRLTKALLPHLLRQPRATITNVTSGLAFVPLAVTPTYSATKAALHSYTLSLRHQLRDTNVTVTELIPPYVQTTLMGEQQAVDPAAMPLDAFIAETMQNYDREPAALENRVEIVDYLRFAERDRHFDEAFGAVNSTLL